MDSKKKLESYGNKKIRCSPLLSQDGLWYVLSTWCIDTSYSCFALRVRRCGSVVCRRGSVVCRRGSVVVCAERRRFLLGRFIFVLVHTIFAKHDICDKFGSSFYSEGRISIHPPDSQSPISCVLEVFK